MEFETRQELFTRFVRNECTRQEIEALLNQFEQAENEIQLREIILEQLSSEVEPEQLLLPELDRKEVLIYANLRPYLEEKRNIRLWLRISAAASVILALSFGGYFLMQKPKQQQTAFVKSDILPGHQQATLTLSNGNKITLTRGMSGALARQGHTIVGVNGQHAITYTPSVTDSDLPVVYNTLSTAAGEESPYPLLLADGTKVWLDAKSSITFPVAFTGRDRMVKVTGQAYFEVAHHPAHPFKVSFKNQIIEDIGTSFNVNAYDDEPFFRTTLLEGRARVSKGNGSAILTPGEQAITQATGNEIRISKADTAGVIAWKEGHFHFESASIQTVMRQLARWYNVEVEYEGNIPERAFSGNINRNSRASVALQILSLSKIHFKIQGQKIIVTP